MLMLAAMTYNTGLFLAATAGISLGHMIFSVVLNDKVPKE
jgi:hypothetical protein